ncbi:MAG: hypothetical protein HOO93_00700 [Methyloglobulus sp.]|nr:hypothetical protein [Methyloglobulus sp.]
MSNIEILKLALAKTSQGNWDVRPIRRPDLDDDPMCEYLIDSHQAGMTDRYHKSEAESKELKAVHNENSANAEFIMSAHNLMPDILAEIERLHRVEAGSDRVKNRSNLLESTLIETSGALCELREQIEQMRGLFDDEDGAIQAACTKHDLASKLIGQVLTH